MTTTVATFLTDARNVLQDNRATKRWSDDELIAWANLGMREMVAIKPEVNTKVSAVRLSVGTRQLLPADGVQFFRVLRNMGTNGTTVGPVVRGVDYDALDTQSSTWHSMTPVEAISEYAFRPSDPTRYYVYPPSDGNGYVDIEYGALPADCVLGGNLTILDVWVPTLLNYVLYRAYSKDAEFAANANLAASYYSTFGMALGHKAQAEATRNQQQAV
jgi:hypothetical protein